MGPSGFKFKELMYAAFLDHSINFHYYSCYRNKIMGILVKHVYLVQSTFLSKILFDKKYAKMGTSNV